MSDKPMVGMAPFYAQILPELRVKARELGYALGVHGSMVNDFDLIAMPWVEEASDAETLAKALAEIFGAKVQYHGSKFIGKCAVCGGTGAVEQDGIDRKCQDCYGTGQAWKAVEYPGKRPHGRIVWTIVFASHVYIDLSVMPLKPGCPTN